jgi:hypothetical protein
MNTDDGGAVRVGRCLWQTGGYDYPKYPGFTNIIVLTKSSPYGSLGPYVIADDDGHIMENIWQFSKLYPYVPKVKVPFTVRYPKIVWEWGEEVHINEYDSWKNNKIAPMNITPNDKYWHWRKMGFENADAIRYPVGRNFAQNCLYALKNKGDTPLNYVEAREQIYAPVYKSLVRNRPQFKKLKRRLESGENLLIIETDGPHGEDLDYYKDAYGVDDDFIVGNTMLITPDNIDVMLNDTKHAYGHGYCLATALLDI